MGSIHLPPQSYIGWKVGIVLLHLLSILSTSARCIHRFRIRQTWWDDYIVAIPLIVDIAFFSLVWVRFPHPGGHAVDSWHEQILNSYWLTTLPCITILWTTRSVLALSLARLFPHKHPVRQLSFFLVAFMVLSCVASIAITIATCKQKSVLLSPDEIQACIKALGGYPLKNILLSAGDLISSFLLILTTIWILFCINPQSNERCVVRMVLVGSILTILCGVVFIAITVNPSLSMGAEGPLMTSSLGNMEAAISLLVCNLVIIPTCFFPWLRRLFTGRTTRDTEPGPGNFDWVSQLSVRSCGCTTGGCPTPLTLTEISDLSSHSLPQSLGNSTNYSQSIAYVARSSRNFDSQSHLEKEHNAYP